MCAPQKCNIRIRNYVKVKGGASLQSAAPTPVPRTYKNCVLQQSDRNSNKHIHTDKQKQDIDDTKRQREGFYLQLLMSCSAAK